MTILSSQIYFNNQQFVDYARKLISYFLSSFKSFYKSHYISYNLHGLLHLVKDVEKFETIDKFSTYHFENYLGQLKKKFVKMIHHYNK